MDHQVQELTRYLKPVKETKFNDFDIIQALLKADIDPEEIASVTQLRGVRLGVIRVAMRTTSSVSRLDELIKKRKLCIGDVALGEVEETGHFVRVLLENVPLYVSDSDVEEEMAKYGSVIRSDKEYLDFEGCRIANEKRVVLFSNLSQKSLLNKKQLNLHGNTIFATVTHAPVVAKNRHSAIANDSVNKQLADAVQQLAMARRKSLGAELKLQQRENDFQPDDELMTYLRRRNSFKVKGETNRGQMSSVAYRQSTVVRDVALSEKPNFEIFSWNDAKKLQDKQKDSDVRSEEKNKLGWLKKFSGSSHKTREIAKEENKNRTHVFKTASTTETTPQKESKREVKNSMIAEKPSAKVKERSSTKKSGILKTTKANLHQKPKSCNETFNSFVEMRRKQKRNEAFQQLSAYLL